MTTGISEKALQIVKRMQQNELTESFIYAEIAKFAKGEKFKPRFLEMTLISVTVAVVSFLVGILAKQFLGVDL